MGEFMKFNLGFKTREIRNYRVGDRIGLRKGGRVRSQLAEPLLTQPQTDLKLGSRTGTNEPLRPRRTPTPTPTLSQSVRVGGVRHEEGAESTTHGTVEGHLGP